jgi:hypothetical protein
VAALCDEDVSGLDVAMDDAFEVGGIESFGDLDGDAEEAIEFDRLSVDEVLESTAVKELHGDESAAVFFANVVDGADIGVVEGRGSFGFATEAFERLAVGREFLGKKFEGDEAIEAGVLRFVNHTHAATAEAFENAVVGDSGADERTGIGHVAAILGCDAMSVNEQESLAAQVPRNAFVVTHSSVVGHAHLNP